MKRIICIMTCFLLVLNFTVTAFAAPLDGLEKSDKESIIIKLAPYQTIIDKINSEYGSSINIPESGIFEVYNNIKDIPLNQLEANLRRDYLMVKDGPSEIHIDATLNSSSQVPEQDVTVDAAIYSNVTEKIGPLSYYIDKRQYADLDYGRVYLDSEVYSPTGATYYYNTIYGAGHVIFTDRLHFRGSSYTYTLGAEGTQCDVRYTGTLFTADGTELLAIKIYSITYYASN